MDGVDDSPPERYGFRPELQPTDVVSDRIRITLDTDVAGWNETDSVELWASPPSPERCPPGK